MSNVTNRSIDTGKEGKSASPRLLVQIMAVALCLQSCSLFRTAPPPPAPKTSAPAPAPVPPPQPITETRRSLPAPVPLTPVPGAEKADIRVGDRLWYRGGEGNARPSTILREVTSVQNSQVQYKQSDIDANGRPSKASRARRQSLTTLELDNPGKVSGQVRYTDFPLALGKTWSYRYQLKGKTGALTTYDIAARVESEETITTPAGTYKVLRILHGGQWNVPVVDNGVVKVSSGSLRSTLWFAPSLGNWVRFESEILNVNGDIEAKISQELVRFERNVIN